MTDCRCSELETPDSVSTCPVCLPTGAITWLIEHGRQVELFPDSGVLEPVRGLESIEKSVQKQLTRLANDPQKIIRELPF